MNFLNPIAFFFALLVPLVVLLYLLRLKRREVIISATLLWKKSIEDLTANAPFQKLRRNLLLFLQILIILLTVFLLARPFVRAGVLSGVGYVVLIDNSASMQARDMEGRSRLEAAQERALELVETMTSGDRMMIMAFSNRAEVIENWTSDKEALRAAIHQIEPRDLPTDLSEALIIALTLCRTEPSAMIRVFSDGKIPDLPEVDVDEAQDIDFIPVGESDDNVGITTVGTARVSESYLDYQVLAGVQNFSDRPRRVVVEFHHEDRMLDAKELELEPLGRGDAVFTGFGQIDGVVELRLSPTGSDGILDVFPLDDRAWTVIPERREADVLLVSAGNPILETVLSLDTSLRVTMAPPEAYGADSGADLVVFDNFAPQKVRPGRYMFFGVVPPVADIIPAGTEERPVLVDWDRSHPVNRFVGYDNLNIEQALRIELLDPTESLAESTRGALIAAFERAGGIRGVYVGFDLYESEWPLRFSFPVFMANSVQWLLGAAAVEGEYQFQTGDVLPVKTERAGGKAKVTDPGGVTHVLELGEEESIAYFAGTDWAGVYEARIDSDESVHFAVNLVSPEESDIRPMENLDIGNRRFAASTEMIRRNVELWKPVALLAFLLLAVEWWVYTRKAWI